MAENTTLEQQARDLLERAGVEDAQSFTAGDLVEIANLLGRVAALAAPVEPVAMGVPVGWIDEFGNVFPLGAWVKSEVREKWKPLYTTPPAQPAPAVPAPFDRTTALVLLQAASKSGDPGAISLAAQLAGAAPCTDCGYVNFKCRCAAPADTRKLCTCDGAGRGPGRACVVQAGGRLGDLWKCSKSAAPAVREALPTYSSWVWKHTKSGGEYQLIGNATIQTDTHLPDMADVYVYQGDDGRMWVRPVQEFNERFKRIRPLAIERAHGDSND